MPQERAPYNPFIEGRYTGRLLCEDDLEFDQWGFETLDSFFQKWRFVSPADACRYDYLVAHRTLKGYSAHAYEDVTAPAATVTYLPSSPAALFAQSPPTPTLGATVARGARGATFKFDSPPPPPPKITFEDASEGALSPPPPMLTFADAFEAALSPPPASPLFGFEDEPASPKAAVPPPTPAPAPAPAPEPAHVRALKADDDRDATLCAAEGCNRKRVKGRRFCDVHRYAGPAKQCACGAEFRSSGSMCGTCKSRKTRAAKRARRAGDQ